MVIGSDWRGKDVVGQEYAQELCFYDRIGNYSTTNVLKEMK
jgi:D-beta-D-heptose 7-phosphate kinase/D-beta-D-heptose 1-phosphate adenosyltransferase